MEELVVSEMARIGGRSSQRRLTNSVTRCCASAALPPLPAPLLPAWCGVRSLPLQPRERPIPRPVSFVSDRLWHPPCLHSSDREVTPVGHAPIVIDRKS